MKTSLFAATLLVSLATVALAQGFSTRFGALTTDNEHLLLFQGRPVTPKVQGNNSLTLLQKFEMGSKDVVLVQDNGGTACPTQYHFVTVSKWGAKATKAFGTCNDLIEYKQQGDVVSVAMPGYKTQLASDSEAEATAEFKRQYVFVFKNGQVTETAATQRGSKKVFNPFTFYFPVDGPPAGFDNFQAFALEESLTWDGRRNISGGIVSDFATGKQSAFKQLQLNPQRLSFTSKSRDGESFSFEGRFLRGGDLELFSPTSTRKAVVVLEGTAKLFVGGKQKAVAKVRFHSREGVS